jgi:hypothetical protein
MSELVNNVFVKLRRPKGKDGQEFTVISVGIKLDDLIKEAEGHKKENGFINFDILKSKGGNFYSKWNDWKPETKNNTSSVPEAVQETFPKAEQVEETDDDCPF